MVSPTPTPSPTQELVTPISKPSPIDSPTPEPISPTPTPTPIVGQLPVAGEIFFSPASEQSPAPQAQGNQTPTAESIAEPIAKQIVKPQPVSEESWPSYFGYVIGIGSAGFASVGAFRGARILRAKRMLRKFS